MTENHRLTVKSHEFSKLLNDLYEEINGNYIETLRRDDELTVACTRAELDLITKIFDEVNKID